jgi:hypothetical protein
MFVVWSGKGLWIFVVLIASLGIAMAGDKMFGPSPGLLPVAACGLVTGLFALALGLKARFSAGIPALERQTGREITWRPVHSIYWIRAEWWGVLFVAGGVALALLKPKA